MTNPIESPEVAMGQHRSPEPSPPAAEQIAQKILVVDDEEPMRVLAASIIKRLGHVAVTAGTGEEAVELYSKHAKEGEPFSVVVMDLALPGGISGIEATLAIKQIRADARVIVSSGYLEQNARGAALEHGFSGILPKP